jgi:hypothetical protein
LGQKAERLEDATYVRVHVVSQHPGHVRALEARTFECQIATFPACRIVARRLLFREVGSIQLSGMKFEVGRIYFGSFFLAAKWNFWISHFAAAAYVSLRW